MTIRACHLVGVLRCAARRTSITFVTRITHVYTDDSIPTSPPSPPRHAMHGDWEMKGGRWTRGGCLLYRSRGKEWPTVRPRKRPLYVTYVAFVKGPVVRVRTTAAKRGTRFMRYKTISARLPISCSLRSRSCNQLLSIESA